MRLEMITQTPTTAARPTPILFVHGMFHAAWCWSEHFLPFFAQHGYTAHALSLRGHGGSAGHERLRWTPLADYVADVAQAVDQMERKPILVGHSMGGLVVQKFLESHEMPAAVLLGSAPPRGLLRASLRIARQNLRAFLEVSLTLNLWHLVRTPERYGKMFYAAGFPAETLQTYHTQVQEESFRAYVDMLGFNLPRPEKIKTPLLVLGAAEDMSISPAEVEATARAYHTRAEIFPAMGHALILDTGWQAVAQRALEWLDQLPTPQSA
ncbi:MAG TPA: alpha/beta fold hydrolase [Anaerolineae bacterium]|nr:alpha/beta fold hydrolase [Anaerolineae bacterium]